MTEHPTGTEGITPPTTTQAILDPLRRVFVPIERKNLDGTAVFFTTDKTQYIRGINGEIRRARPKVKK